MSFHILLKEFGCFRWQGGGIHISGAGVPGTPHTWEITTYGFLGDQETWCQPLVTILFIGAAIHSGSGCALHKCTWLCGSWDSARSCVSSEKATFLIFHKHRPMTEPSIRDSIHLEEGHFFSLSQWQHLGQCGPLTCPTWDSCVGGLLSLGFTLSGFIYLLIFSCAGPSRLHGLVSSCREPGLL